ncbi:DUF3320 domain-containing protein [Proteinivorax hydrogeniformans]|uniref:DUF3320 domain-containing protein n=1 Tax=Proteinivorax hydrogeniformans TaxID=1826727 RepID=A0AAU8HUG1_9FIRM
MPERSLKWHYRSRHEHLITFSNAKIYQSSLITFPSHVDKMPGYGVEYDLVKDGVYDRSKKRNNVIEAKRVACLVFEHLQKSPGRSLGVITFSGAQQQAVDSEIRKLRLQNPQYEEFFKEDKDEPFFIKNLENVQGDERDTIIFSIGYAKDASGVMYMNFGPLSREGGYRRLNVAITRAKYNVKLVGSIHPTDIELEKTNSEGVKLLRAYIEFAINGPRTLEKELTYDKVVNLESPFEEAVYDFLVSKGFRVATQVGCSGYRIDMAIKHPTLDGRFVIGIECDGATYHSSRTARERDRLRQDVLENMGWKIYRVWSTDWIKDSVTEGEKLVEVINNAISEYNEDTLFESTLANKQFQSDKFEEQYLETEVITTGQLEEGNNNGFDFPAYKEANISEVPRSGYPTRDICNIIEHVVEYEYPIHFELLCKRIAPFYGNKKATVKIRRQVDSGISKMSRSLIQKGDFLYPKNYESVVPRIPGEDDVVRAVEHISPDELISAMLKIISVSYGITKESLFQVTARQYGYNRMGSKIQKKLEEAFGNMLEENKVEETEGRVTLKV